MTTDCPPTCPQSASASPLAGPQLALPPGLRAGGPTRESTAPAQLALIGQSVAAGLSEKEQLAKALRLSVQLATQISTPRRSARPSKSRTGSPTQHSTLSRGLRPSPPKQRTSRRLRPSPPGRQRARAASTSATRRCWLQASLHPACPQTSRRRSRPSTLSRRLPEVGGRLESSPLAAYERSCRLPGSPLRSLSSLRYDHTNSCV